MKSSKQHLFEIDFFLVTKQTSLFFVTDQFNVSSMVAKFPGMFKTGNFPWELTGINGNKLEICKIAGTGNLNSWEQNRAA